MVEVQVLEAFRVRAVELYPEVVDRYVEALARGEVLPPAVAARWPGLEGPPVLLDGRHRMAAWARAKVTPSLEVREATGREQALRWTLRANSGHGHPRGHGDVTRCVEVAVEEWPDLSAREIAGRVGCSHTLVNRVKAGMAGGRVETVSTPAPVAPAAEVAACGAVQPRLLLATAGDADGAERGSAVADGPRGNLRMAGVQEVRQAAVGGAVGGGERVKDALERWYTPPDLALACVWALEEGGWLSGLGGRRALEPSVGAGAWIQAVREVVDVPMDWIAYDLAPAGNVAGMEGVEVRVGDFTQQEPQEEVGLIIGNPPYRLAQEFVERGLAWLGNGGVLALLLPIGFLASAKRYWLWNRFSTRPNSVYVVPGRPSFEGPAAQAAGVEGRGSWQTYALIVWWRDDESQHAAERVGKLWDVNMSWVRWTGAAGEEVQDG